MTLNKLKNADENPPQSAIRIVTFIVSLSCSYLKTSLKKYVPYKTYISSEYSTLPEKVVYWSVLIIGFPSHVAVWREVRKS